jgi:iron complex transport system substrate-binding protein
MNELLLSDPMELFGDHGPQRVVSLVPSWTDSLSDLGLSQVLVGITNYCPEPQAIRAAPVRVGGAKTPQVKAILDLRPDLVVANREENGREAVLELVGSGVPVWLTFPTTVRSMISDLWTAASLFRSEPAMERVRMLEIGLEWAESAALDLPAVRYFCPVWEDRLETGERWWMTFNGQTYSNDVLRLFNGQNVFAERQRRYPLVDDV